MAIVVLALLAALSVAPAEGQADPSPHGWVVIDDPVEFGPAGLRGDQGEPIDLSEATPESESEAHSPSEGNNESSVLLHIPPRIPVAGASPAPDLRVARVARLAVGPEWLIPIGSTVYAIMPADDQGVHRVGRSRVYPRGLRDLWGAQPVRRLEVLPAVAGDVRAVAAQGESPLVVIRDGEGLRFMRFRGNGWEPAAEPLIEADADRVGVISSDDTIRIAMFRGESVTWAINDLEGWSRSTLPLPGGLDAASLEIVGSWNGELIAIVQEPASAVRVMSFTPGESTQLGVIPAGDWKAAAVLADPGRLVLVSTSAEATEDAPTALPSPGLKQRKVIIAEFSLVTGSLLAIGEATASSPVSRGEVQSLALLLVAAMVVVLVVVVRPSPTTAEPVLPPGTALAPSGRRLVASLADLLPSLVLTGAVLDISVLEALGPIALPATGSIDVLPLLMALGITALHSAIGEMLTGRSLGKMLTGTFVARVDPVPGVTPVPGRFRPPTPAGALVRNTIKWFLFPAVAIVLSDPRGRHRGDLIARSAVLIPVRTAGDAG
jgi:uncharacterized RDD family membrane protein YckC